METGIKEIAIAGGVSAKFRIEKAITTLWRTIQWSTYIPDFQYCTDNAGMIAITAYYKFLQEDFCKIDIPIQARMNF